MYAWECVLHLCHPEHGTRCICFTQNSSFKLARSLSLSLSLALSSKNANNCSFTHTQTWNERARLAHKKKKKNENEHTLIHTGTNHHVRNMYEKVHAKRDECSAFENSFFSSHLARWFGKRDQKFYYYSFWFGWKKNTSWQKCCCANECVYTDATPMLSYGLRVLSWRVHLGTEWTWAYHTIVERTRWLTSDRKRFFFFLLFTHKHTHSLIYATAQSFCTKFFNYRRVAAPNQKLKIEWNNKKETFSLKLWPEHSGECKSCHCYNVCFSIFCCSCFFFLFLRQIIYVYVCVFFFRAMAFGSFWYVR